MAEIIGGVGTTHVPSIGTAIARGLQQDPYWKPFFDGFSAVHEWLARTRPDVAVVFYNDHGLNFFLDTMPTFAVGAAGEYRNSDEGWGLPVSRPFPGDAALSWHVIESLVADEFDVTTCQEMLVDHAFTIPLALLWPGAGSRPVGSDRDQHRPASAAVAGTLLQVRPGGRPRHRKLPPGPQGPRARDRRTFPPTRRHAGRLHQQGIRPVVPR
jgi:Catalytic LigB subunit of aromatic ring-opening dioxygenase